MSDLSLDDQIKQAQIEKTRAEARKLDREGEASAKQARLAFWADAVKVIGGTILVVGGIMAAITQFEVAEQKAKIANRDLEQANGKLHAADSLAMLAVARRDSALKVQENARQAIEDLKREIENRTAQLQAVKPELVKSRLAYIQFKSDLDRDLILELRKRLSQASFNAPGAERILGEYKNQVKYFDRADSADAARLGATVEEFFASKGCPIQVKLVPVREAEGRKSPLEVWLGSTCK